MIFHCQLRQLFKRAVAATRPRTGSSARSVLPPEVAEAGVREKRSVIRQLREIDSAISRCAEHASRQSRAIHLSDLARGKGEVSTAADEEEKAEEERRKRVGWAPKGLQTRTLARSLTQMHTWRRAETQAQKQADARTDADSGIKTDSR